jgi:acetyl esterase
MDPQVEALLQMMNSRVPEGAPQMWELPAAVSRANTETGFALFNQPMPVGVSVSDRTIPGPAGQIPVKVFTPAGPGPFPLLVYLHGGGWTIMSPGTHQKLTAELAEGGGVVVVSVDYRMAPENPAPACLDDSVAAIRWAVAHAAELNADGERFAVGGDSAGGNLTAAAMLRLRDEGGPKARLQLLLYGAFEHNVDEGSVVTNGEGKILTRQAMVWFWDNYLSGGASDRDPYVAPLYGDLHDLPPARLIVGTLDPLLDDSKKYAAKLTAAGVPATLSIYPDQPHVFMQLSAMLDGGRKAIAEACSALKAALA